MASRALDTHQHLPEPAPAVGGGFTLREMAPDDVDTVAWDSLAIWASDPNPFAESWYLRPAIKALGAAGKVSLLCLYREETLCGLLPIARCAFYYRYPIPHLVGWLHGNAFVGSPLVAPGCEKAFWRALLEWADDHAGLSLFMHLSHMPLSTTTTDALVAIANEQNRTCRLVHEHQRAMLRKGQTPEDHWNTVLDGKKRKELRRQTNRLGEKGTLAFIRQEEAADLARWTDQFLALEARGWKGDTGNAMDRDRGTRALFIAALEGAAKRGRLERLALTLNGEPIAMLANFITAPGSFAYKTAFDERYSRFSPGVLLQQENLALLTRDGIDWCDSCAVEDHPMIDKLWHDRRPIGRFSIAIGGPKRRALFHRLLAAETRGKGSSA